VNRGGTRLGDATKTLQTYVHSVGLNLANSAEIITATLQLIQGVRARTMG
jgi:hypothetical protein